MDPEPRPAPGNSARRQVAVWLLMCCVLIAAMVSLGGVTRLTGSGLSMVTWKPVHGVVPPLTEAAWQEEFARYRASPEYVHKNAGMGLEGFKRIFWFEYSHRVLGRAIGLAFAVPLIWFLIKRRLERRLAPRLVFMFLLGAGQGLLGWWMVKSGLVDEPRVSQYRLTAHLGLAMALFVWMFWTALSVLRGSDPAAPPASTLAGPAMGLLAFAFLTVLSGGFVAGLHAGLVYNSFPTMGGEWIPSDLLALTPAWRNPFENVTTVQFNHRWLATLLVAGVLALWAAGLRRIPPGTTARRWMHLAALAVLAQGGLGIATLLGRVPLTLAAMHQANALVLLAALTGLAFTLRHPRTTGASRHSARA